MSQIGSPALDKLLNIFQYPRQRETPTHQQPWASPERGTPAPPAPKLAAKLPVIELTSASPCSGASQILHYITAVSILPATFNDIQLQGKGGTVVILDNSGNFNVLRLQQIMRHYIQQRLPSTTPESHNPNDPALETETYALIRASLHHVHIFRPQSSAALLATIQSLSAYLLSPTHHFSGPRPLEAILIDDIGAFVWQDRAEDAAAQSEVAPASLHPNLGASTSKDPNPLTNRYQALTSALRTVQSLFACPVIVTTRALFPLPSPSTSSYATHAIRPHLPSPWPTFPTLRLIIDRVPVPKFRESLSVQGAWREAGARREVVERAERVVGVNWWGWEGWRAGVGEGLEREGCAVRVWVGGDGVVVEEKLVRWRGS